MLFFAKKFSKETRLQAHIKAQHKKEANDDSSVNEVQTEMKPQIKETPVVQIQQHETQTFVLKPATMIQNSGGGGAPNDPNLLPTSLQHALSQHQKAVGIPQTLHPTSRNSIQVSSYSLLLIYFKLRQRLLETCRETADFAMFTNLACLEGGTL